MIEIKINTRTFKAPTSWAECNRAQAERLSFFIGKKLFVTNVISPEGQKSEASAGQKSENPVLSRFLQEALLQAWLRADDKFWKNLTLTVDQFHYLLTQAAWICDIETPITLPFDYVEVQGKKLFFSDFSKITALEIAWLNVAWLNYVAIISPTAPVISPTKVVISAVGQKSDTQVGQKSDTQKSEESSALAELLAIYCRPIRKDIDACRASHTWNGDIREPLSEHGVKAIEALTAQITLPMANLILRYLECQIKEFVAEFSQLFGKANDTVEDWQRQTGYTAPEVAPVYPEGFGWEAHLRRVAKEGTFGTYQQVCETNGKQIWYYELQKYFEAKAEAKAMEDANKKRKGV